MKYHVYLALKQGLAFSENNMMERWFKQESTFGILTYLDFYLYFVFVQSEADESTKEEELWPLADRRGELAAPPLPPSPGSQNSIFLRLITWIKTHPQA